MFGSIHITKQQQFQLHISSRAANITFKRRRMHSRSIVHILMGADKQPVAAFLIVIEGTQSAYKLRGRTIAQQTPTQAIFRYGVARERKVLQWGEL
ncbi:hypothetical protein ACLOJK_004617 [Asimina triloba]